MLREENYQFVRLLPIGEARYAKHVWQPAPSEWCADVAREPPALSGRRPNPARPGSQT